MALLLLSLPDTIAPLWVTLLSHVYHVISACVCELVEPFVLDFVPSSQT